MPLDAGNSTHYVIGPVVAIVLVCLLGLVAKWVFGSGRPRTRAVRPAEPTPDHGLLRTVAELPDRPAAMAMRAVLSDAGIRSTFGVRRDGRVHVLVFPDDEERARRLVPPGPGRPGEDRAG
jgi:hypothetical protein